MAKGAVVALGIFDGVHRGHGAILKKAVFYARQHALKTNVITFFPHPGRVDSVTSLAHRKKLISSLGVDACIVIPFTKKFSQISPEHFIQNILVKKFAPRAVFIGENFTFGKNAAGTPELLKKLSRVFGFKVFVIPVLREKRKAISSTAIRVLIKKGEIAKAGALLGRPVSVLGTVVAGRGVGRLWKIPTANINPHHEVLPADGVYAVRVRYGKKIFRGVCFIGIVSLTGIKKPRSIEVHIFDFGKNIYGHDLDIQFVKKLRNVKIFSSRHSLLKQIIKDIQTAKQILK